MAGIAQLACELGHKVTGSDANVYPPMSDQLKQVGVTLMEGYAAKNLDSEPDLVLIGNVLSRGNPEVEAILDRGLPYKSGPQWLAENVLQNRWVLGVAGTHGKTTCSSLLAWVLEEAGMHPGFLIGGVPNNFDCSARLGSTAFFVVEADEYDTAFFDKRSKFVHYHPRTLILNNLEFDHADIFSDIDAIKTQFHHLIRTVPQSGLLLVNTEEPNLRETLDLGCWSQLEYFGVNVDDKSETGQTWSGKTENEHDGREFDCITPEGEAQPVVGSMEGRHGILNTLAVIAAARHAGVPVTISVDAIKTFSGVKRRMEVIARESGVTVYDDFAHHPTAVETTLRGLRSTVGQEKIYALLEMRSNTMRMGYHREKLLNALKVADFAVIYAARENDLLDLRKMVLNDEWHQIQMISVIDDIVDSLRQRVQVGDHIIIMSNGAFHGIHEKISVMLSAL